MMDTAEFRQAVNIGGAGVEPNVADSLLAQVTAIFERQTNRLWKARTAYQQVWYPEPRDQRFWLEGFPVVPGSFSISAVGYDETLRVFDPRLYTLNLDRGELALRTRGWGIGFEGIWDWGWSRNIQLQYDFGYLPAQVPPEVKLALTTQARFMFARMSTTKIDVKSSSMKGSSTDFMDADYHPMFRQCIANNRRVTYGNGC